MGGPSIVSVKFGFWLVWITFMLHYLMIPTTVTGVYARTYKEKRGVRLIGSMSREAYVPSSIAKRFKGQACANRCHFKKCSGFNIDESTGECELFDTESGGTLEYDPNSSYFAIKSFSQCGEMAVENGRTVASGVKSGESVDVICNDGFKAKPAQATCNNGMFNTVICVAKLDRCMLLIGGVNLPSGAAPVEYYNPSVGVECNMTAVGNMSTERLEDDTYFTSGCYLPSTKQVVIRESEETNKPSMLYGLTDGSAVELPLPYENKYLRDMTAAAVAPSKCISCGGTDGSSLYKNCYQFDPSLDGSKWTPISNGIIMSQHPSSVSLNSNDFYQMGGWDGSKYNVALYRLNVANGTWTEEPSMSKKRMRHAAAALSETEVIVCGGYHSPDTLSSCEVYDTTQKTWNVTGSMKQARRGFVLINFGGAVYALGGEGASRLDTVEKYDPVTGEWEFVKAMKHPRTFFFGVAV